MLTYKRRTDFYEAFPKGGIGAELGVADGGNAELLWRHARPKELHLIDCWDVQSGSFEVDHNNNVDHKARLEQVRTRFLRFPSVHIHVAYSLDAVTRFSDGYLDWIYIDANHTRDAFLADLNAWWPKVKNNGGIVAGHDYLMEEPNIEVKDALDEWMAAKNLRLTFVDQEHYTSWGIVKCQMY